MRDARIRLLDLCFDSELNLLVTSINSYPSGALGSGLTAFQGTSTFSLEAMFPGKMYWYLDDGGLMDSRPMEHGESAKARGQLLAAQQISPLWMMTKEPMLNRLIVYLSEMKEEISAQDGAGHVMVFSRSELAEMRQAFTRMITQGERLLHQFCNLIYQTLIEAPYTMQSVVVGELPHNRKRFIYSQPVVYDEISQMTDLDFGNSQLRPWAFTGEGTWHKPELVANYVEYLPVDANRFQIHKVITRIKAEEEIWNKVVDEIFRIDELVRLDKELRPYSHFVKDIFGLKMVVASDEAALELQERLSSLSFARPLLSAAGVEEIRAAEALEVVEVKNYLGRDFAKKNGWSAIKSVVRWHNKLLEIQVQPLQSYYLERDHLTKESHAGFKLRREKLRKQLSLKIPLFEFYRNLLRWLFLNPEDEAPRHKNVDIVLKI